VHAEISYSGQVNSAGSEKQYTHPGTNPSVINQYPAIISGNAGIDHSRLHIV